MSEYMPYYVTLTSANGTQNPNYSNACDLIFDVHRIFMNIASEFQVNKAFVEIEGVVMSSVGTSGLLNNSSSLAFCLASPVGVRNTSTSYNINQVSTAALPINNLPVLGVLILSVSTIQPASSTLTCKSRVLFDNLAGTNQIRIIVCDSQTLAIKTTFNNGGADPTYMLMLKITPFLS